MIPDFPADCNEDRAAASRPVSTRAGATAPTSCPPSWRLPLLVFYRAWEGETPSSLGLGKFRPRQSLALPKPVVRHSLRIAPHALYITDAARSDMVRFVMTRVLLVILL